MVGGAAVHTVALAVAGGRAHVSHFLLRCPVRKNRDPPSNPAPQPPNNTHAQQSTTRPPARSALAWWTAVKEERRKTGGKNDTRGA